MKSETFFYFAKGSLLSFTSAFEKSFSFPVMNTERNGAYSCPAYSRHSTPSTKPTAHPTHTHRQTPVQHHIHASPQHHHHTTTTLYTTSPRVHQEKTDQGKHYCLLCSKITYITIHTQKFCEGKTKNIQNIHITLSPGVLQYFPLEIQNEDGYRVYH